MQCCHDATDSKHNKKQKRGGSGSRRRRAVHKAQRLASIFGAECKCSQLFQQVACFLVETSGTSCEVSNVSSRVATGAHERVRAELLRFCLGCFRARTSWWRTHCEPTAKDFHSSFFLSLASRSVKHWGENGALRPDPSREEPTLFRAVWHRAAWKSATAARTLWEATPWSYLGGLRRDGIKTSSFHRVVSHCCVSSMAASLGGSVLGGTKFGEVTSLGDSARRWSLHCCAVETWRRRKKGQQLRNFCVVATFRMGSSLQPRRLVEPVRRVLSAEEDHTR